MYRTRSQPLLPVESLEQVIVAALCPMMPSLPSGIARVFRGAVCSPGLRLGEISLEQRIVGVGQDGRVAFSFTQDSAPEAQSFDNIVRAYRDKGVPCTVLSDEEYLLPGFVDTHYHAPQYSFTGTVSILLAQETFSGIGTQHPLAGDRAPSVSLAGGVCISI